MRINNAHPKCGPVLGGTELVLVVDMDAQIAPYLFNLCVGFQARPVNTQAVNRSKKGSIDDKKEDKKDEDATRGFVRKNSRMGTITPSGSRFIGGGTQTSNGLQLNPLDPTEQQLELDYWHCATATYDAGKIVCQ